MNTDWEKRVADFWTSADDSKIEESLAAMKLLIQELDEDDPNGLFEWASVHDFLGLESKAIPIYKAALDRGLEGLKREMAVIQLASSLRNVGQASEAIDLIEKTTFSETTALAARAFLSLAHFDVGNHGEAMSLALAALYPEDGLYSRSIKFYAKALGEPKN